MKIISSVVLCIVLGGCSYADIAKTLMGAGSQGISTDLQIGDDENTVSLGDSTAIGDIEADEVVVNQTTSKPKFEGVAENVTINESDNKLVLILVLLGLIGWLLPTPQAMYKEMKQCIKSLFFRSSSQAVLPQEAL